MDKELKLLFDEDQHETANQPPDGTPEYVALRKRCKARIRQVMHLLGSNPTFLGVDYLNACIILLHGDNPEDFWNAYNLALKAVDKNYDGAKRFAAAAFDKWLMYQGKPQKFGLQYVPDGVKLRLWDIDDRTTDKERLDWDVPPLEMLIKNVEDVNMKFDITTIDMENKPQWLKDAIKRWNAESH